jgi:hypothetical protein
LTSAWRDLRGCRRSSQLRPARHHVSLIEATLLRSSAARSSGTWRVEPLFHPRKPLSVAPLSDRRMASAPDLDVPTSERARTGLLDKHGNEIMRAAQPHRLHGQAMTPDERSSARGAICSPKRSSTDFCCARFNSLASSRPQPMGRMTAQSRDWRVGTWGWNSSRWSKPASPRSIQTESPS